MSFTSRKLIHKITLLGGILLLVGYGGFQWHRRADESSPPPPAVHPRVSQSKFTAKGMTYTNSYDGKPLIVMKVSSLEFGKKKMGFFRVGGVRQLELRGADIDYYEPFEEGRKSTDHVEVPMNISSEMLTAAQSIAGLKGRLAGLQVHRVMLHYHTDGTQTDIEGDLLEIHRSDKSLRIQGNAHVRHAGRSLSTDEIFFQPQEKTFFTKKIYTLTANGTSVRGSEVRTDLFLNPLPEKTMSEHRVEASKNSNKGDGRAKYFENGPDSNR